MPDITITGTILHMEATSLHTLHQGVHPMVLEFVQHFIVTNYAKFVGIILIYIKLCCDMY